ASIFRSRQPRSRCPFPLSRLSSCQPYSFSLLVLSRLLKQRVQRIKPSRQCIDVLARRNAQAVQAAGHALVESLLDLLETTFHLALGFGDAVFHCIDLAVGRVDLLV